MLMDAQPVEASSETQPLADVVPLRHSANVDLVVEGARRFACVDKGFVDLWSSPILGMLIQPRHRVLILLAQQTHLVAQRSLRPGVRGLPNISCTVLHDIGLIPVIVGQIVSEVPHLAHHSWLVAWHALLGDHLVQGLVEALDLQTRFLIGC